MAGSVTTVLIVNSKPNSFDKRLTTDIVYIYQRSWPIMYGALEILYVRVFAFWLHIKTVEPTGDRSPISVLTGIDVEQLC